MLSYICSDEPNPLVYLTNARLTRGIDGAFVHPAITVSLVYDVFCVEFSLHVVIAPVDIDQCVEISDGNCLMSQLRELVLISSAYLLSKYIKEKEKFLPLRFTWPTCWNTADCSTERLFIDARQRERGFSPIDIIERISSWRSNIHS